MSLRHVILSALIDGPATGYDIARRFDLADRYFWNASHQQIYRDLKALETSGLVVCERIEQDHRPDRKLYQMTPDGLAELDRWTGAPSAPKVNSELLVKLNAAAAFGPERIRNLLTEQRAIHVARLENYRQIESGIDAGPADGPPTLADLTRLMALRRGILGERDWVRWIDEALALLDGAAPITD